MEDKFNIILLDPPWKYQNWTDNAHGAAISHYKTMSQSELLSIPVRKWANKDCLMFMWATWPKLNEAIELIEKWFFVYITGIPWIKVVPSSGEIRTGIGFWFQSVSELLLISKFYTTDVNNIRFQKLPTDLGLLSGEHRQFYSKINKHSQKPMEIYDWIEYQFNGPYLELFATQKRDGWTSWGKSLGFMLDKNGVHQCND